MCFHCKAGNPQHHIPTEYREIRAKYYCCDCDSLLTSDQINGVSPHWCHGKYILIRKYDNKDILEMMRRVVEDVLSQRGQ